MGQPALFFYNPYTIDSSSAILRQNDKAKSFVTQKIHELFACLCLVECAAEIGRCSD